MQCIHLPFHFADDVSYSFAVITAIIDVVIEGVTVISDVIKVEVIIAVIIK